MSQLIDRVLVRPKGATPSADSWHRDSSPYASTPSLVFGGWLKPGVGAGDRKKFVCQTGSHKKDDARTAGIIGFEPIKDKALIGEFKRTETVAEIPPGHIILFHSNIAHCVYANPAPRDMFRIFLGMYLSVTRDVLYRPLVKSDPRTKELRFRRDMTDFVPIIEKSDQFPPMVPKIYWSLHTQSGKYSELSKMFLPEFLEEKTMQTTGVKYRIIERFFFEGKSLKSLGLDGGFLPYDDHEMAQYLPHKLLNKPCGQD